MLVYDADRLRSADRRPTAADTVAAELVRALTDGPGVVAIRGAFPDTAVVDRATAAFDAMIADEKAAGGAKGDHFAKAGANDRVWNALEKLALRDPSTFVDYYANDVIALVSRAWLGPGYQVTSQVNVVRPGRAGAGPAPRLPPRLPGERRRRAVPHPRAPAVAGADPAGSGRPLGHAGRERADDVSAVLPPVRARLPRLAPARVPRVLRGALRPAAAAKGDAAFFNPALFHGAGTNVSADIQRVANLLQVSSAFGRAMETVDRDRCSGPSTPRCSSARRPACRQPRSDRALAAAAEGYPFPTNLDLDQPVGGMTPASQAELAADALAAGVSAEDLAGVLDDYAARRATS